GFICAVMLIGHEQKKMIRRILSMSFSKEHPHRSFKIRSFERSVNLSLGQFGTASVISNGKDDNDFYALLHIFSQLSLEFIDIDKFLRSISCRFLRFVKFFQMPFGNRQLFGIT